MSAIYLSVLKPATSSANITVTITTLDAEDNTPVTKAIAISNGDSAITVAKKIAEGLTSHFNTNSLAWNGVPTSSGITPSKTFQVTRADHVVCIWSECQIIVEVTDSTSARPETSLSPLFLTLAELTQRANVYHIFLTGADGSTLSENDQVILLRDASSSLVNYLNNSVVATTYIDSLKLGDRNKMLEGRVRPGLSWDTPVGDEPDIADIVPFAIRRRWRWVPEKNQLWDLFGDSPFQMGNPEFVKWSYTAGYNNIPDVIKGAVLLLSDEITRMYQGGYSVGSVKIDAVKAEQVTQSLSSRLRVFKL